MRLWKEWFEVNKLTHWYKYIYVNLETIVNKITSDRFKVTSWQAICFNFSVCLARETFFIAYLNGDKKRKERKGS